MKYSQLLFAILIALMFSACTTGKISYKINDQGQMVVEKTVDGEFAIRGSASEASYEAAEFEKNMTITVMYRKYLSLLEKGDFENAKKVRIEIEVLKSKIPSTPDTPVIVPEKKDTTEVSTLSHNDPSYWKKRKAEIMKAKREGKKPPIRKRRFESD